MNGNVSYSQTKDDLYFPCKNARFFSAGPPPSDAALCAELSRLAYCRTGDTNFALNQTRISTELARVGFKLRECFESQGKPDGRGTHCLLALSNDEQKAVVAFRGTDGDDPSDVADDANGVPVPWDRGGRVHAGFQGALEDVRVRVEGALDLINVPTVFTGHSLGAALATLLASVRHPDALYTFGSPLVGDPEFVATLRNVRNYRYVDCCDIVTRVPPEALGYEHLGQPYYIARNRSIVFNPGDEVVKQDRLEAFLEYPFRYQAWKKENVGVRELADHAPVNYVAAVWATPPPS